ncbi:DUF262 domain-containing protein [Nocardioides panacis]|uniref:DUF262 domain-containing protein n=1 Tax=Nocardioides panacis TaxID=2849501 RepID=A0A975SXM5_9ACTN|nr:DUF262 domain-containing protein [Nocardioides panacis]QWZ07817.1 DUF262 domain-containing protein [Nocardioides panacis]
MSLEAEIDRNRQSIRSDGYAMSIGEVLNLYRDEEIRIRPEFQRLFRWPIEMQARLIESILLDIPLPTIFVAQAEDGVWEVVDGLQRLSTILLFMGELRDEVSKEHMPPSTLVKTKYLPALEGMLYTELPQSIKLQLKRARLDFRILLRESDDAVKYELFDRLNSGGMATSPQEVRTALVIMRDPTFHLWLQDLRNLESLQNTVAITDRQLAEQYDLELLVRFLVYRESAPEALSSFADIDSFLTERLLEIASDDTFDRDGNDSIVRTVFDVIWSLGPEAFRKFDAVKGKTVGAFSVSAYEAVTSGVATNLDSWIKVPEAQREALLRERVQALWSDSEFLRHSGAGIRATTRAPKMPAVGARIFSV